VKPAPDAPEVQLLQHMRMDDDASKCSIRIITTKKMQASSKHLMGCFCHVVLVSCQCPAANVFGPEEGSKDVYNGSGCRDVVGAVLGGCNGEWMECAAYPASYPASLETQQGRKCSAAMQCLAEHCSAGDDDSRHLAASTTP
jgi:hypothetical protein